VEDIPETSLTPKLLSPLEASPIWAPPAPGTTSTSSTTKPTKTNAISELKLAFSASPEHVHHHVKMCLLILQLQQQQQWIKKQNIVSTVKSQPHSVSLFEEKVYQIRKSILFNSKVHKKFEYDVYVMLSSLMASKLALRPPSLLKIVPHKPVRAQQVDMK
jgi:hypothetical protein